MDNDKQLKFPIVYPDSSLQAEMERLLFAPGENSKKSQMWCTDNEQTTESPILSLVDTGTSLSNESSNTSEPGYELWKTVLPKQKSWKKRSEISVKQELMQLESKNVHTDQTKSSILHNEESWHKKPLIKVKQEVVKAPIMLTEQQKPSNLAAKQQSSSNLNIKYCVLCKKNGETREKYMSHSLKDSWNRVTCPVLYALKCKHCGATGSDSHTEAYCPKIRHAYIENASSRPPVLGVVLKQTKRNKKTIYFLNSYAI
uniref:Nanos-type domain-containing protein n=1 Tax=Strigamia maritima TaxID=126957 RepID=T1JGE1_STRMM